MSKNITIAEGAQAKNFNSVAKIRTNLIGGGTQNWIPEDEAGRYADLGEVSIDENGTYRASDEGLDGFSKITVNVPTESGGGGHEPRLITKNITANGTYNASGDGADGYSSVTVNVQATHGRTIVNGLNNAPVSQRISTRDFFDDLNEQAYAAGTSYFATDSNKAWLQDKMRQGGWINELGITDIYNYNNLMLVGAAGICHHQWGDMMQIWVGMVGIMDESGIVTLSDLSLDGFTGALYNGNKFTDHYGRITWRFTPPSKPGGGGAKSSNAFTEVKNDIINHVVGSDSVRSISAYETYTRMVESLPHTSIITNLTGGTIA